MDAAHKHLMDPPAGLPSSSSNMMSNVSNLTRTRSLRLGNSTNNNGLFNESFPVIGGLARSGSFRSNHRPSLAQVPCTSAVLANSLTLSPRTKHRQTLVAMKDALLKSKNLVSRKSGFDFTTNVPPSGRMSSGVYMMNGNRSGMNNTSHGSHRSSFYQSSNAFTMSTSCPDKSNIGLESPSSPVNSTSSIDSALRDLPPSTSSPMHTSSSMAMSLRRLTEEHDRLQNEYSKLRQQYIEVSSLSNLSSSSIPSSSADKDRQLLLTKISELEKQVRRTEDENADLKENLDFISSERDVLSDAIRELEDSLNQEKKGRQNEKESLEELATHSTVLYDKVCSKNSKIKALEEQIQGLTQQLEQLNQQKEDKTAALELLIDSWVELETTMKQTFHGTPSSTDLPLRPQNEMQLMNSMKKLAHFVEKSTNEVSSLKEEISGLVQENLDLKKRVKEQSEFDKLKKREDQLKQELDDERDRASTLNEEVDNLKERLRCSEVIAGELKRQLTQLSASNSLPSSTSGNTLPFISNNNNPVALKQELKTVKEVIASREEMIQKLNEKYMRHRQVWEENERRANDEIKKLDEIIDRVVMALSNCSPLINDCPPLKRLLEELTADQQNISNLSSTFV